MDIKYRKTLAKIVISIFILLIVLVVDNIDSKNTNEFSNLVKKTIDYNLKLNDKRILNLKKAIASFNITTRSEEYGTPIEGTLYKKYSENNKGIDVLVYDEFVKSIGGGEIIKINVKKSGTDVLVSHGNISALYSDMEKINVNKGEKVLKGHIIGTMGDISKKNKYFHFRIYKDKKTLDPLRYIKLNDQTPLSYE